ncbi:MAG TPA: VanW family protein, partial [Acidimicrobiales bacterium]|nr:VanW family protein [Acidimicrobiales bacterium]
GSGAPQRHDGRDRTLVLGGAAAAEGRTSGPLPRIAGPTPTEQGPSGAGNGHGGDHEGEEPVAPRHVRPDRAERDGRQRRWWLAAAALPVLGVVLLVGAWAVDTAALSGQVQRNVEVAGRPVGGLGEQSLPDVMAGIAEEIAARPVIITSRDQTYETTAGQIGLTLDERSTSEAALDAGRRDALVTRPFTWVKSFFTPREVDVRYTVSEPTVAAAVQELQGDELRSPRPADIRLSEEGWVAVEGVPGEGIDTEALVEALPEAAARSRTGPIEVNVGRVPIAPAITDDQARQRAEEANQMTANGLELTADGVSRTVPPEQLRTWIKPVTEEGELQLAIKPKVVRNEVPQVFADIVSEPQNARIELGADGPVVIPSENGVTCCGEDSPQRVRDALFGAGPPAAELEVAVTEPDLTTEEAEGLGVNQPVCGNHAWRDGAPATAGPGFTTYHNPGESRVANIHRIADIVDGTLVLPGETFSINAIVGERTTTKGFVEAGAIRDGEHVDEVGGGVSQFSTTTFNAAFFCGLDIIEYQAHSEYFSRYPRGREATMGYPAPDLAFVNNTPHGILVDTSYTDTSITVTMWSTTYARGEQVDISESPNGKCTNVTVTRRVTYPDREPTTDTFQATYRPGEGEFC